MAIAYIATSQGGAVATSLTIAHTNPSNSNVVMVFSMYNNFGTDFDPTCTYNGSSATQANEQTSASGAQHGYMFVLNAATADGASHNVVWTPNASANMNAIHTAYSGASAPSNVPDANVASSSSSVTTKTQALVSVADNCWHVGSCFESGDEPNDSTGVTQRGTPQGNFVMGDSNGPKTPAGSYSMTFVSTLGTPQDLSIHMVAIAPYSASTSSPKFFPFLDRR